MGSRGRYGKWSHQIETMLSQGRRNSAAVIINRLRSGSLPGWAGGGTIFPKMTSFSADCYDREAGSGVDDEGITMKAKDHGDPELWRHYGNVNLGSVLSALYAKLLVVMGIAFPMSEVISTYIRPSFYDGFYLYLYFMSIIFMLCMFSTVLKQQARRKITRGVNSLKSRISARSNTNTPDVTDVIKEQDEDEEECGSPAESDIEESDTLSPLGIEQIENRNKNIKNEKFSSIEVNTKNQMDENGSLDNDLDDDKNYKESSGQRSNFGSFYLRMGAVAFGIGSLIYSGLEFGQYFELEADTECRNYMAAITPCVRMVFTFMQMYFIFLNSQMAVSKTTVRKQFGLMHLIGTNLCVWLSVIVQETKHEILHFYDPENQTIRLNYGLSEKYGNNINTNSIVPDQPDDTIIPHASDVSMNQTSTTSEVLHRLKRGLMGPHSMYACRRTNIMGSLVDSASPFLFPCTIEYSLICAAICYVMWKSISKRRVQSVQLKRSPTDTSVSVFTNGSLRSPHHYTVDCAGSNKGLFTGIFFLVFTIVSLILNFVLIKHPEYKELATLEVNVTEIVLYSVTTVAVLIGMCQLRQLRYESGKNLELDNILLIVAQSGSFVFNCFCIIGGHLTVHTNDPLVLVTPLLCFIQLILQTLFILDASKRVVATTEHIRRKPGREIVTFLLVCNLAMWLINALEKSRGDSHPNQLKFYGVWGWTIITDISMPLAIFYRFHSTVCLCEIWKKAYKVKPLD